MPVRGSSQADDVVLFVRVNNKWSSTRLHVPGVAYVDLSTNRDSRYVLAEVHADESEEEDVNSLFLFSESSGWSDGVKLISGRTYPVYDPVLVGDGSRISVLWRSPANHRKPTSWVELGLLNWTREKPGIGPVPVLGDSAVRGFAPVVGSGSTQFWIEKLESKEQSEELRLLETQGDSLTTLLKIKSPFLGPADAVISGGTVVIVGPIANVHDSNAMVVTGRMWIDLACSTVSRT
jgi:hypothetical protein